MILEEKPCHEDCSHRKRPSAGLVSIPNKGFLGQFGKHCKQWLPRTSKAQRNVYHNIISSCCFFCFFFFFFFFFFFSRTLVAGSPKIASEEQYVRISRFVNAYLQRQPPGSLAAFRFWQAVVVDGSKPLLLLLLLGFLEQGGIRCTLEATNEAQVVQVDEQEQKPSRSALCHHSGTWKI